MSRPRSPERDLIVRNLLAGLSTKEIAYELGRTVGGVSKIASNAGVKKQYVTDAEFLQLLNQRKQTA
jgi:DNA-binding NarL/FixJ family response regulator